ncbi:MAG TPA: hypothetical protein VEL74_11900, partial [Thermoanaerobaculia bacterium]|nr:hypothetical protein [Thermoanaerobaculia bacterium]
KPLISSAREEIAAARASLSLSIEGAAYQPPDPDVTETLSRGNVLSSCRRKSPGGDARHGIMGP